MLCVALTTADTWLGSFIIARSTPYMISDLGYGAYFFFGVILIAMGIWSFFFVPETRGEYMSLTNECSLLIQGKVLRSKRWMRSLLDQYERLFGRSSGGDQFHLSTKM